MQSLIEKLGLGERTASLILWIGLSVVILIVVVALAAWLVRILRPSINMSGGSGGRSGRPQRLAVTDAFSLDRDGRKLVIVRRDNVEHLLLIGGPNDVLVESSIVRGERAGRRGPAEDYSMGGDSFATPDLPPPTPPSPPAFTPVPAPPAPMMPPPAPTRAPPAAPPVSRPMTQAASAAQLDDEFERSLVSMAAPIPRATQPAPAQPAPMPAAPMPPPAPRQVPPPPPPPVAPPPMAAPVPPPPPPAPPAPPAESPRPARQEPVSEMARRLNEVLQKPLSGQLRQPFNKAIPPVPPTPPMVPPPPAPAEPAPVAQPAAEPRKAPPLNALDELDLLASMIDGPKVATPPAPPPAPAPTKPVEADMDMLEEEMARLLGRPNAPKAP